MDLIRIAKTTDFDGVPMKSFRILGRYVAVIRDEEEGFYAIEAGCKHANADLTKGDIRGDIVTCTRHGWQYNLRTGECLTGTGSALRRYHLEIDGDDIRISPTPVSS